jgi:dTDP-4-amino-4,6-dideoxygalactose transaminase
MGPEHDSFEKALSSYLNIKHVFGVASGTDAICLALRALGATQNSVIATVANAGGYTSVAAAEVGCKVIYIDIEKETHLIDLESLQRLEDQRIDILVVTHLYGNAARISEIVKYCKERGIKVIEDCAQALGAVAHENKKLGAVGDIGITSFYPTKNLGGVGDGGALFTNSDDLSEIIRQLRQYGWKDKYNIVRPGGRNSRLDELQAAVLNVGLQTLDSRNAKRRAIMKVYDQAFESYGVKILMAEFDEQTSAHLSVLQLSSREERIQLQQHLSTKGVAWTIHYPLLDSEQIGLTPNSSIIPKSVELNPRILSLPCFDGMLDIEVDYVVTTVSEFLNAR